GGPDTPALFHALWAWRTHAAADPAAPGLRLELRPDGSGERLAGALAYQANRWHQDSIRRLAAQLGQVLAAGAAAPDAPILDLPLLDAPALAGWLALGSGPELAVPGRSAHELIEAQAARAPEALAVAQGMRQLSYAQLNQQAELIALRLLELGLRPDERVGIAMDRSPALIAAMLGVLKAGGAYVPLDPSYPEERLAFIAADSGLRLLLTQADLALGFLPPGAAALLVDEILAADPPIRRPLLPEVAPEQTAYVIYTSGSTGQPKGVLVPHRALVNYLESAMSAFGLGPGDRVLQFTSISFDASVEEIFATLASGATLMLRTDWMLGSPRLFLQTCQEWGVTVLDLPTAYWHLIAAALADDNLALPEQVRLTVIGGEAAQPARLRSWRQRAWRVPLLNAYGPTETTIASTLGALKEPGEPGAPAVTLGRPVANTMVYILDDRLQPVPPGVFGEIHIGGAGVARGYLGRPGLTAERFLPDPFGGASGARMYRTGDEGRFRPDGALEFRSRLDDQIKFHGYRIEVAEIEALLRRQPHVREALVLARPDERQQLVLAAYVVPKTQPERLPLEAPCAVTANGETFALETRDLSLEGMRLAQAPAALHPGQQIEARLASPATGQELVLAGTVVWRRRLEAGVRFADSAADLPELARAVEDLADTVFVSPQHQQRQLQPLQRQLAHELPAYMVPTRWQLLRELPKLPNGKLDRRALPLPAAPERQAAAALADSPLLAGLGALWAEALGRQVDAASHFFEFGGQSLQAMQLLALIRQELGLEVPLRLLFEAPTLGAFAQALGELRRPDDAAPPLRRQDGGEPAPLSFAQQRLWFFDQLRPGNTAYTIALTVRIDGPLDAAGLQHSLGGLVRRHEILRTTFMNLGGEPAQIIHPPRPAPLPLADLSGTPPGEQETLSAELLASEAEQPFDLAGGPLLRCVLVKLGEERHHLLVTVHHSVFDGTSAAIFVDELFALYQAWRGGEPAGLPALPVQYADFARWQRQALSGERLAAQRRYWVDRLAGAPMLLALRTDFVRPRQPSLRGAVHRFQLPAATLAALRDWSQREGHTLFMTLMAAFQALLHRHSGQTDILVGTAAANRPHQATAGLIGFFVNTLVFSARIEAGLTFRELLGQVHETALQAFEHQDLPFDQLVEALGQQGNLSSHPVVQAMFILQPPLEGGRERGALRISAEELDPQQARLDLALELEERPDGLAGRI
ncbi:MAG TPA: amino acid adenylation domain-containing protein, partial [Herpetosiphonaceae bacterium]